MKEFDPSDLGSFGTQEEKQETNDEDLHISDEQLIDIARLEKEKTTEAFRDITDEDFDDAFIRRDALVKIYTTHFKILGNVLIPAEGTATRLTDLLNFKERNFVPITNAKIMSLSSGKVVDSDCFVIVNKTDIKIIVPIKEPPKPDAEVKY
jgi:hypothetical protein